MVLFLEVRFARLQQHLPETISLKNPRRNCLVIWHFVHLVFRAPSTWPQERIPRDPNGFLLTSVPKQNASHERYVCWGLPIIMGSENEYAKTNLVLAASLLSKWLSAVKYRLLYRLYRVKVINDRTYVQVHGCSIKPG